MSTENQSLIDADIDNDAFISATDNASPAPSIPLSSTSHPVVPMTISECARLAFAPDTPNPTLRLEISSPLIPTPISTPDAPISIPPADSGPSIDADLAPRVLFQEDFLNGLQPEDISLLKKQPGGSELFQDLQYVSRSTPANSPSRPRFQFPDAFSPAAKKAIPYVLRLQEDYQRKHQKDLSNLLLPDPHPKQPDHVTVGIIATRSFQRSALEAAGVGEANKERESERKAGNTGLTSISSNRSEAGADETPSVAPNHGSVGMIIEPDENSDDLQILSSTTAGPNDAESKSELDKVSYAILNWTPPSASTLRSLSARFAQAVVVLSEIIDARIELLAEATQTGRSPNYSYTFTSYTHSQGRTFAKIWSIAKYGCPPLEAATKAKLAIVPHAAFAEALYLLKSIQQPSARGLNEWKGQIQDHWDDFSQELVNTFIATRFGESEPMETADFEQEVASQLKYQLRISSSLLSSQNEHFDPQFYGTTVGKAPTQLYDRRITCVQVMRIPENTSDPNAPVTPMYRIPIEPDYECMYRSHFLGIHDEYLDSIRDPSTHLLRVPACSRPETIAVEAWHDEIASTLEKVMKQENLPVHVSKAFRDLSPAERLNVACRILGTVQTVDEEAGKSDCQPTELVKFVLEKFQGDHPNPPSDAQKRSLLRACDYVQRLRKHSFCAIGSAASELAQLVAIFYDRNVEQCHYIAPPAVSSAFQLPIDQYSTMGILLAGHTRWKPNGEWLDPQASPAPISGSTTLSHLFCGRFMAETGGTGQIGHAELLVNTPSLFLCFGNCIFNHLDPAELLPMFYGPTNRLFFTPFHHVTNRDPNNSAKIVKWEHYRSGMIVTCTIRNEDETVAETVKGIVVSTWMKISRTACTTRLQRLKEKAMKSLNSSDGDLRARSAASLPYLDRALQQIESGTLISSQSLPGLSVLVLPERFANAMESMKFDEIQRCVNELAPHEIRIVQVWKMDVKEPQLPIDTPKEQVLLLKPNTQGELTLRIDHEMSLSFPEVVIERTAASLLSHRCSNLQQCITEAFADENAHHPDFDATIPAPKRFFGYFLGFLRSEKRATNDLEGYKLLMNCATPTHRYVIPHEISKPTQTTDLRSNREEEGSQGKSNRQRERDSGTEGKKRKSDNAARVASKSAAPRDRPKDTASNAVNRKQLHPAGVIDYEGNELIDNDQQRAWTPPKLDRKASPDKRASVMEKTMQKWLNGFPKQVRNTNRKL